MLKKPMKEVISLLHLLSKRLLVVVQVSAADQGRDSRNLLAAAQGRASGHALSRQHEQTTNAYPALSLMRAVQQTCKSFKSVIADADAVLTRSGIVASARPSSTSLSATNPFACPTAYINA